jgi:hypothetical protein
VTLATLRITRLGASTTSFEWAAYEYTCIPNSLGYQHLEQLPTACHESPQMAGRLIRQGTLRRWTAFEMSNRLTNLPRLSLTPQAA